MNIKMHREDRLVEIFSKTTTILIDQGKNLDENEVILLSDLQNKYDFSSVNAIFNIGYKTDYMSMTKGFLPEAPVYSGKISSEIALSSGNFKAKSGIDFAGFYSDEQPITIGDIKITPYLVDDAKHDGYMFLIESGLKNICYAGDFRSNSRKNFVDAVARLPVSVDVLICGDEMIADYDTCLITEGDVQAQATKIMNDAEGVVFILQSVTDFDRATTMFLAANQNKRLYLEDLYMAEIAKSIPEIMPSPSTFVKAYLTKGYGEEHFRYKMFKELDRIANSEFANEKIAINIRPSMKKFLKTLAQRTNFKNSIMINAMPEDSTNNSATSEFVQFARNKGLQCVNVRTSGHADAKALDTLITKINPRKVVPLGNKSISWLRKKYTQISILNDDDIYC